MSELAPAPLLPGGCVFFLHLEGTGTAALRRLASATVWISQLRINARLSEIERYQRA
jgi:hypothetical protein